MSFLDQPITTLLFGTKRKLGTIAINVILSEETNDSLVITKQPVQQGSAISDHAFKQPTDFSMRASWSDNILNTGSLLSDSSLGAIYQKLLDLQSSLIPFTITTPKRIYKDMLFSSLTQVTDKTTENCLMILAKFEQIILVPVTTVIANRSLQKDPGSTGATQPAGSKQPQSVANMIFGGG